MRFKIYRVIDLIFDLRQGYGFFALSCTQSKAFKSLTESFVEPAFNDRLTSSTTERNATVTFLSINRTDSANYVFGVLDSSDVTTAPLKIIVECKYRVNLCFVCNTENSVLKYICITSYYIDVILY